jgi:hypothetical protein
MKYYSAEEIDAILQGFPDVFRNQFGKEIDYNHFHEVINKLLLEKETQLIEQRFFDLSPQSLRVILEKLKKRATIGKQQTGVDYEPASIKSSEPKKNNAHGPRGDTKRTLRPSTK